MNGNPFYVSPLGGLDLGQTVGGIYDAYNQRQAIDEQKAMQQQQVAQQQAQQKEMQELALKMQNGDMQAGQMFYAKYPEMAAKVDAGMKVQSENQAKQVGGFFEKLVAIPTLKGKRDFLQKTAGQTPFTIDDDLLAMDDETLENSINITAPRYLSKEQLAAVGGGPASPEYTNIKRGEDGNLYGLNKQTQQMERIKTPEGVSFGGDSGQTINVNTGADEQSKVIDKYQGEAFVTTQKNATDARAQLQSLNSLDALSEKAFSGTAANLKKNAAKFANAFGIDVEGLSETEIFDSVANELTLGKTAMMTGVLTDRDMEFLQSTVPQLTQTAEGRKKLIKIAKKIAERKIEYAKEAAKFRRENKGKFNQYDFENYLAEKHDGKDFLADYYPTDDAGVTDFSKMSTEELNALAFGAGGN